MSAFGGKADIIQTFSNVCYPKRAFSALFDHLVGGHEERLRSQIDDEIVFDCSTMGSQGAAVGRPGTARAKL